MYTCFLSLCLSIHLSVSVFNEGSLPLLTYLSPIFLSRILPARVFRSCLPPASCLRCSFILSKSLILQIKGRSDYELKKKKRKKSHWLIIDYFFSVSVNIPLSIDKRKCKGIMSYWKAMVITAIERRWVAWMPLLLQLYLKLMFCVIRVSRRILVGGAGNEA